MRWVEWTGVIAEMYHFARIAFATDAWCDEECLVSYQAKPLTDFRAGR
jgi:hypothetical protein